LLRAPLSVHSRVITRGAATAERSREGRPREPDPGNAGVGRGAFSWIVALPRRGFPAGKRGDDALAIALVLAAALLHATWNAVLRSRADRLWSIAVMGLAACVVALPFALALPAPAPASWPYLLLSAMLQTGYSLFLVLAYGRGDFGQVYPIARGTAPLLVTLGAALFARELPSTATLAGIALVSLGILSLSYAGRRAPPIALGAALTTGLFIAAYGVTDGIGSRLSGTPIAYAAWLNVLYTARAGDRRCRARTLRPRSARARDAQGGGERRPLARRLRGDHVGVTLAPLGAVSALRETSVVFAALIGRVFLAERLTLRRIGSCAVIAIGAICLSCPDDGRKKRLRERPRPTYGAFAMMMQSLSPRAALTTRFWYRRYISAA